MEASKLCKDKIVLDAACYFGYGSFILSKTAKQVYSCDQKEEINFAKKHFQEKNIIFQETNLNNLLPYKDKFFDVIVACEIIEHLNYYKKFISECHRILKPNGILFITTPNAGFFKNIGFINDLKKDKLTKKKGHFHFKEFEVNELTKLLATSFKIGKIYAQYIPRKPDKMRWAEYINQFLKTHFIVAPIYRFRNINDIKKDSFMTQIQIARKK